MDEEFKENSEEKLDQKLSNDQEEIKLGQNEIEVKQNKSCFKNTERLYLIMRIVVVFLFLILIPFVALVSNNLKNFEIINCLPAIYNISASIFSNSGFFEFFGIFTFLLYDKDVVIVYTSLAYFWYKPFLIIKLILTFNFSFLIILVLNLLYSGPRPYWEYGNGDNPQCYISFSSPSPNIFISFYFIFYSFIIYRLKEKKEKLSLFQKVIVLLVISTIMIFFSLSLIFTLQNYVYEILFSFALTIVLIGLYIDLEERINNFIYKMFQNIDKIRKYKIMLFFYTVVVFSISIIIYNFLGNGNAHSIIERIVKLKHCSNFIFSTLGIGKNPTFLEITYFCGFFGAFCGLAFTIESNLQEWWNSSFLIKLLKSSIALITSLIILLPTRFFYFENFSGTFVLYCFKYFIVYFINLGILPFLFEKMKLNDKKIPIDQISDGDRGSGDDSLNNSDLADDRTVNQGMNVSHHTINLRD